MGSDVCVYLDPSPPAGGDGPLGGVRVTVQPNLSVRDWPTEAGSKALERFVALEDAAAVERLRAAGAAVVGSTRMSELGFGLAGDSSAAALAGNICDAALVTDTLGEARWAAAAAGAVGFKPSHGVVSRLGLIGLVPSMECLGVVAGSVERAAAVVAAVAGPDERDFSMLAEDIPDFSAGAGADGPGSGAAPAVGIIREALAALAPGEADALRDALRRVEAAGVEIRQVTLPDFDLFQAAHNVIGSTEASSSAGKYDSVRYGHRAGGTDNWNDMYVKSRAESFGPLVKSYLFQGAYFQFKRYEAFEDACRIRGRLIRQARAALEEVDFLALPTRRADRDATAAATVAEVYDAFALTLPANVTGAPAVSLPGFVRCGDADLGLQIVAGHLADAKLLAFAAGLAGTGRGGQ